MSMNEIFTKIAEEHGIPKAKAERIIKGFFETVKSEVNENGSIQLYGLGTLKKVEKAERTGRNPKTGESIKIPKKNSIKFTAAKSFKDYVN